MYYDYAMAAPFMAGINDKEKLSILVLGNGTGTYATQCTRYFDNVEITGVEIDQKITDLANVASEVNAELNNMMQRISSEMIRYNPGNYIMTDDKAPVELLGMKVIDELIREEVAYYKQVYKEGGIKALLEEL